MGNDSGGQGKSGRRKKRGWRKHWYKKYYGLKCPAGSFKYIASPVLTSK